MAFGCGLVAPVAGASTLPDGRAYELVSPPGKNGGDVMADSGRLRAAADGSAAGFASLSGFGDVIGTGVATDYLSVRDGRPGTSGWSTHAITPKQDPLSFPGGVLSMDPLYEGEFSADLSQGVFRAWSPVTDVPNVADVVNVYLRTDLRTPGAGSYQLLSDCAACGSTPLPPIFDTSQMPRLAGASADFGHLIFESPFNLTADAPPQGGLCFPFGDCPRLYEWDHGTLRLAGILPDGSAAAASVAGQSASLLVYTTHTISADGSRIVFSDNSGTAGGQTGVLYMRIDHATTVQLNASERTDCAGDPTCGGDGIADPSPDPNGAQPATYWDAAANDSRVFFTTSEQLTDDDDNGNDDLYMYDLGAAAGHHLTRLSVDHEPVDPAGSALGAIGASADGHTVYFVASGQLVLGQPDLSGVDRGIYEWHDGDLFYVGELSDPAVDTRFDLPGSLWSLTALAPRVTPDGNRLLFLAHDGAGLLSAHGGTDYDQTHCGSDGTGECSELYLYTAASHDLACVSCNPSGAPATSDAIDTVRASTTSGSGTTWHLNHPLSDDGSRVFFSTGEALVAGDANGKVDAYEYDTATGALHLLSSGTDPSDSFFMDASTSGRDAFVLTRQPLVGWDVDQSYDLYDARVGGGFPEPPLPEAPCSADGCQGAPSGVGAAPAPGSALYQGPGNVKGTRKAPPRRVKCKRGFVRRKVRGKVRCVKKRKRRAHARTTSAATSQRSSR